MWCFNGCAMPGSVPRCYCSGRCRVWGYCILRQPDVSNCNSPVVVCCSALLYGFRAVVVSESRSVDRFHGHLGLVADLDCTGSWGEAESTGVACAGIQSATGPAACLVAELEQRYESAFAGIVSGVAQAQPRLSGVLVITMLAVIGSPLFPGFFSMLSNVTRAVGVVPCAAVGVAAVWLLWSWSGARLLQDILVGPAYISSGDDLSRGITTIYIAVTGGIACCRPVSVGGAVMSLSLGMKTQIRSMVFVAGEPIPNFWPMRAFIHHNPLHGLEQLSFERRSRKGNGLFHGAGFLPRVGISALLPARQDRSAGA